MQKKPYKFIFSLLIILLVPVIITGCSGFGSSNSTDIITEYSLRINEIEYNFSGYENYEKPRVEPKPGLHPYEEGSTAYLNVFPTEDIIFYEWGGEDGDQVTKNNTLKIDSPKIITPIFGLAPEDNKALVQGNIEIKHNFPYSKLEDESFYSTSSSSSTTASAEKLFSQSFSEEDEDIKELIIRFDNFIDIEQINEILADLNFEKIDQIPELNSVLVKIPDMAMEKAIELAEKIQGVRYAEPNQRVRALDNYTYNGFEDYLEIPNENQFSKQWHYPLIRLPQAWNIVDANNIIRVAIIDSGIDISHNNLEDNIDFKNKYNFIDENKDLTDNSGHGTHVAGTIGANLDNAVGIARNIELLPLKALDLDSNNETTGKVSDIADAILYSAGLKESDDISNSDPVDIINLSLGIESNNQVFQDAIITVVDNGVIVVASSGNDGGNLLYPAKYNNVISVGSVSLDNNNFPKRTENLFESNFDSDLDFVAPGVSVLSTFPNNEYKYMSGTSMAAPHVTGLIGLMLSQEPDLDLDDIRERLAKTSMKISEDSSYYDEETGYGLINAYWALNDVQEIKIILGKEDILQDDGSTLRINLNNDIIEAEKSIPLDEFYEMDKNKFNYLFNGIEPGDYILIGLIDVNNDSSTNTEIIIEPGDYFFIEELISLQADNHYEYKIELEEYDGN